VANRFFQQARFEWHNFAFGLYGAHLDIAYGTKGTQAHKTIYFFVFPWQLMLIIFFVLLVVFLGGRMLLRKYNEHIIALAEAHIRPRRRTDAMHE
jgi:type VI protein secretion system component VasF